MEVDSILILRAIQGVRERIHRVPLMVATQLLQFQFQFLNHFKIDSSPPQTNPNFLTRRNNNGICRCTRSGDNQSGSRWYSDDTVRSKRFDFTLDDDGDFGFESATKKRNWWSGDGDDEDDEDDELGVLEGSISAIALITKVMKAFGWMVPAILISMIVGTGPNAFFMALALPLAQTALSLLMDTFMGKKSNKNSTRYKSRTNRRRPFATSARSNVGASKQKETSTRNEAEGERTSSKFGGWDELDQDQQQGRTEQSQPKKGKLSRIVRKRDKPLVLRLLIAVFPFLGSWTRFL